ncbi:MAG: hypothetical protein AB2693_19420 [Candidatus Thiodiazotropha sp.]
MSELIKECNEKLDALKSKYVSKLNENGVSIPNCIEKRLKAVVRREIYQF